MTLRYVKNKVLHVSLICACFSSSSHDHIGNDRNPWTRDTMGERRRVSGTGSSEDMARVADTTARADTGHSSSTGSLTHEVRTLQWFVICHL